MPHDCKKGFGIEGTYVPSVSRTDNQSTTPLLTYCGEKSARASDAREIVNDPKQNVTSGAILKTDYEQFDLVSLTDSREEMIQRHMRLAMMTENSRICKREKAAEKRKSKLSNLNEGPDTEKELLPLETFFKTLAYSLNLFTIYRFPYLSYKHGGGSFVFAFLMTSLLVGFPLVFMEMGVGQSTRCGPLRCWKLCPLFQGLGWGMLIVSCLVVSYQNTITMWSLSYLYRSFTSSVPWSNCHDLTDCWTRSRCLNLNGTWIGSSCFLVNDSYKTSFYPHAKALLRIPSDAFFHEIVLSSTDSVETTGTYKVELVLNLCLAWCFVFIISLGYFKRFLHKITYSVVLLPFTLILNLVIQACTLSGSFHGVRLFFTPTMDVLCNYKVWVDAMFQSLMSLFCCLGVTISKSSCNKPGYNCWLEAVVYTVLVFIVSILSGLTHFATLSHIAHENNVPLLNVTHANIGSTIVTLSALVTEMGSTAFWSIVTFLLLISCAIGTSAIIILTIVSAGQEYFYIMDKCSRTWLRPAFYFIPLLIGLSFVSQNGVYIAQLFDNYVATYPVVVLAFGESLALGWLYGVQRLHSDIKKSLERNLHGAWKWWWLLFLPLYLFLVILACWIYFERTSYKDYVFPYMYDAVGLVISGIPLVIVPVLAIGHIVNRKVSLTLPWRTVFAMAVVRPRWTKTDLESVSVDTISGLLISKTRGPISAYPNTLQDSKDTRKPYTFAIRSVSSTAV